jgi:hypothetical protein
MKPCARPLALSCVLLYILVGFAAGACPSSPEQTAHHQHHHKPAAHTPACAWACHATAGQTAVDVPTQFVPVWLVLTSLPSPQSRGTLPQSLFILARPPPSFFV